MVRGTRPILCLYVVLWSMACGKLNASTYSEGLTRNLRLCQSLTDPDTRSLVEFTESHYLVADVSLTCKSP